jgi:hypothetical protein
VFTPILDYGCYYIFQRGTVNTITDLRDTGWVNQGFINVLGSLLIADMNPPMEFNYAGNNMSTFWAMMENQLNIYTTGVFDASYNWGNTFTFNRLIWTATTDSPDGTESLDNLYSGVLIRFWKNYGRKRFLRRFFRAVNYMNTNVSDNRSPIYFNTLQNFVEYTDSANLLTNRTASENFYIAASYGAGMNLTGPLAPFSNVSPFYSPLRQEAITYCTRLLSLTL